MFAGNLGSAVEWADTWNMFYNEAKCHHLHIGSRDLGVNYVIPTYQGLLFYSILSHNLGRSSGHHR